ncbi:MAG: histidine phosphatase family protein [Chloroflexi bacterium]|nr:histidine phosphatase family protein [Chloroflexota bacterium]
MSKLILIKHAQPILDPAVPSRQWRLAEIGRKQSLQLALCLAKYAPDVIVASVEPDELVFGEETADRAHERFATAVDVVLTAHPGQTVAIVAHGTVITLYVAHLQNLEPYPFWRQFELADFVVCSSTGLILNSS